MCGIAGFKTNKRIEDKVLINMLDSISHRGPDDISTYKNSNINFGMVRLSINDLNKGNQPLFNKDKSIVVVYNGEIYNYPQLRKKLEKKGFKFSSNTDGEVICHLYELYGEKAFNFLDGMFAIALYDKRRKITFLSRDIAGEKPLYYSLLSDRNNLAFASEIKALKKFHEIDFSINMQSIWDFPTFLWIPEPSTIYENISAVPRGHYLKIENQNFEIKKIKAEFLKTKKVINFEEIKVNIRDIVYNSIKDRLLSDVPLGSFLSGGLDSSIVSAVTIKELGSLDTFSIGFENISDPYHGYADESENAKDFASIIGSKHHSIKVNSNTFRDLLDDFIFYGDQPFAVSSGLGILAISREARNCGIKVLLSGDCADECFGGYSWYPYLNTPFGNNKKISNEIYSFNNVGENIKDRVNKISSLNSHERAWAWHYYAHEMEKNSLFNQHEFKYVKSSLRFFKEFNNEEVWEPEEFIRNDREFYLPNEMLTKLDRMTMANSIEGRAPFAALSVLDLSYNLKFNHMCQKDNLKWLLKESFSDLIPEQIIRRPKHGFNVPIDYWLKGEWNDLFEETFSSNSILNSLNLLNKKSYENALHMLNNPSRLNGHTLFCYVILKKWLEKNL